MKEKFNGIFIELTSEGLGDLCFGAGLEFEDGATPEYKKYMETLLAGIFCILSTDIGQLEALGAYMMETEQFDWGVVDQDDSSTEEGPLSDIKITNISKLTH